MRLPDQLRQIRWYAYVLIVAGAVALIVAFVLHPTPTRITLPNGHRIVNETEHTVDHAIAVLRVGGLAALVTGLYLAFRDRHPDVLGENDARPDGIDPLLDMTPTYGDPKARSGGR